MKYISVEERKRTAENFSIVCQRYFSPYKHDTIYECGRTRKVLNQILIIESENKLPGRIRKENVGQHNEDIPEEFSVVVQFDPWAEFYSWQEQGTKKKDEAKHERYVVFFSNINDLTHFTICHHGNSFSVDFLWHLKDFFEWKSSRISRNSCAKNVHFRIQMSLKRYFWWMEYESIVSKKKKKKKRASERTREREREMKINRRREWVKANGLVGEWLTDDRSDGQKKQKKEREKDLNFLSLHIHT